MQRLEVSGAVRPIYGSLGVKRLIYSVAEVTWIRQLTDNACTSMGDFCVCISIGKPASVPGDLHGSLQCSKMSCCHRSSWTIPSKSFKLIIYLDTKPFENWLRKINNTSQNLMFV